MKFVKPLVYSTLAVALAACSSMGSGGPEKDKTYRITILHTNDHHGRFWKNGDGEYGMAASAPRSRPQAATACCWTAAT
jgi:2',3'-cyclic-nucleotide 2'-phosphodiesterase (5'-nucleotidase family)